MDPADFLELGRWITEAGLAGKSETAMLDGFCRRAVAAGLPVARALVIIDTLHPVHEGRVARWRSEGDEGRAELTEYGPSSEGEAAETWRRSPFFGLLESGGSQLRIRLTAGEAAEFPGVVALQDEGMTDYLALITRFAAHGVIGEMDCIYSSWATDRPQGFDEGQVEAIAAHNGVQERVAQLNQRRTQDSLPTTYVYVGLHIGEVFYGNIGSDERLDFTVVGPAVNEVARIAAMCRSAERNVLLSQAFAD